MPEPDLKDFLLARIDEDERAAHYALTRGPVDDSGHGWGGWWWGHYSHYHRHDPKRILARCKADRRIVEWCGEREMIWLGHLGQSPETHPEQVVPGEFRNPADAMVLRFMAEPYADHPDFQAEWAV